MPGRVQFIEELCDVVTANQRIPDMWQLAHAYFSEKLVENLSVSKETLGEQEDKCKEMLRSLLDYFTDLLRLAFFPAYLNEMSEDHLARLGPWTPFDETKQEAAGAWLPFCVRHVRYFYPTMVCGMYACSCQWYCCLDHVSVLYLDYSFLGKY
jgi:hypothetical protein